MLERTKSDLGLVVRVTGGLMLVLSWVQSRTVSLEVHLLVNCDSINNTYIHTITGIRSRDHPTSFDSFKSCVSMHSATESDMIEKD